MTTTTALDLEVEFASRFGQNVVALRQRLGWTQEQLAVASGTSRACVVDFEAGRGNPRLDTVARIAAALGTDPGALFSPPMQVDPKEDEKRRRIAARRRKDEPR